jgi:disulfide bond formation protein DsbB
MIRAARGLTYRLQPREICVAFRKSETMTTETSAADRSANMNWTILFVCWLIASVATLGSLFFSEVMGFAPCVLCWWQRIFIYPLVLIFGVGLFSFDAGVIKYSRPLAIAGWLVALYHTLLYWGIIPKSIQPCSEGVPCTEKYIELLGFLSIPFLSFLAFSAIIALLALLKRRLVP